MQGVCNVGILEIFAYALNEWSHAFIVDIEQANFC